MPRPTRRRLAVTLADIAQAAGVGRTTVLRALQDRPDVSPETRARIRQIATRLRYRPNTLARSLITGKSHLVGVLATPNLNAEFSDVILPIERALAAAGYAMVYCSTDGRPETEQGYLQQLVDMRVDGVLALPDQRHAPAAVYAELLAAGVKLVVLDQHIEGLAAPQVFTDFHQTTCLATAHLLELGHRRIASLNEPLETPLGRVRADAFRAAHVRAGVPLDPALLIPAPDDQVSTRALASTLLRLPQRPTALLVRHFAAAIGALQAAEDCGLHVPRALSIMCCGDCWFADMLRVPFSTVRYPIDEVVRRGAAQLLKLLADEEVPAAAEALPSALVVRGSTAPPPGSD